MPPILLASAVVLAAIVPTRAHAQQADAQTSTQTAASVPESPGGFHRFRVAGGVESADNHANASLALSCDVLRLSRVSGKSGDPAALSVYLDSTGDNPLRESDGSRVFGGVAIRTPAHPVYGLFVLGVSQAAYSGSYSYVSTSLNPSPGGGAIYTTHFVSRAATLVGMRLFVGLDVPRTPLFIELGVAGRGAGRYQYGQGRCQLGVRL